MKKQEIAIPVTRDNIGEYVAVLERHGENIGDVDITKNYYYLIFEVNWFVYSSDRREITEWSPEDLNSFLNGMPTGAVNNKPFITIKTGDKVIEFDGVTVRHTTRHGVKVSCEVPSDWAPTRVFQFMESLMKCNL